ncbi:hypothetical protein D3C86_1957880 [compost metagenome]
MFITFWFAVTFFSLYPTNDTIITDWLLSTVILYFPSKSVTIPFLVPSSRTEAPGKGRPFSSVITPETVCF